MKRISIIIAILIFPFLTNAQDFVDQLIGKYQGKKGFTTVVVNKNLFDIVTAMDENDEGLQQMKGMIDNIRIIAMEDDLNPENINFYQEIINQVDTKSYQELMAVKETDNDVVFYAKYAGNDIEELLLIAGGNDENAVISIKGKINLKEMASLSKSVHMKGFEHLEALENE
ncbi:MAG: hypothetical protein PWP52_1742 [Bacteroidales bacterium]|jgi:hypothetical protein|nr:hypothetical protein [Bacteroidales bacterium]